MNETIYREVEVESTEKNIRTQRNMLRGKEELHGNVQRQDW